MHLMDKIFPIVLYYCRTQLFSFFPSPVGVFENLKLGNFALPQYSFTVHQNSNDSSNSVIGQSRINVLTINLRLQFLSGKGQARLVLGRAFCFIDNTDILC